MIAGKLSFIAGLAVSMALGWYAFPHVLYQRVDQPLRFSHKVHQTTAGMACDDCHSILASGRFSAIPGISKCAECHAAPVGETKDEKLLVANYVTPNREIPWKVYSRQPDNVYFSHANHIKLGKLACERCHNDHGKTDTLRPYEFDPISGYSRDLGESKFLRGAAFKTRTSMKMDDCSACHHERNVHTGCLDCHK